MTFDSAHQVSTLEPAATGTGDNGQPKQNPNSGRFRDVNDKLDSDRDSLRKTDPLEGRFYVLQQVRSDSRRNVDTLWKHSESLGCC